MSIRTLEWHKGAPEKLEPGMLVMHDDQRPILIGDSDQFCRFGLVDFAHIEEVRNSISAWAWLIQPHEIEWLESMAEAHGVGK